MKGKECDGCYYFDICRLRALPCDYYIYESYGSNDDDCDPMKFELREDFFSEYEDDEDVFERYDQND